MLSSKQVVGEQFRKMGMGLQRYRTGPRFGILRSNKYAIEIVKGFLLNGRVPQCSENICRNTGNKSVHGLTVNQ